MDRPGRIIITGAGHSGTNLALEILRTTNYYNIYPDDGIHTEDRQIMSKLPLPEKYLTKLATENTMVTKENLKNLIEKHNDLYFVFCLRSPVDTALARIYKFKGNQEYNAANNIKYLEHTYDIFNFLFETCPERLLIIDFKYLITNFEKTCEKMLSYFKLPINEEVYTSYKNIRIKEKQEKYKGVLDIFQSDLLLHEKILFKDFWEKEPFKSEKELIITHYKEKVNQWNKMEKNESYYLLAQMEISQHYLQP